MPTIPTKNKRQINVELPDELLDRVDRILTRSKVKRTTFFAEALEKHAKTSEKKLSKTPRDST